MTATPNNATNRKPPEESVEQQTSAEVVRFAKKRGLSLAGPDGLLHQLTKAALETALGEEMPEHLGHARCHSPTTVPAYARAMRPTWHGRAR